MIIVQTYEALKEVISTIYLEVRRIIGKVYLYISVIQ